MTPFLRRARFAVAVVFALTSAGVLVLSGTSPARAGDSVFNGEIAFMNADQIPGGKIEAIRPDGSERHELTAGAFPTYSLDGTKMASLYGGGIAVGPLDGTAPTVLLPGEGGGFSLSWSPDETT
ncbi:MAG: hypothetical protein QOJ00_347, partial [Actinomycetota bacterium]